MWMVPSRGRPQLASRLFESGIMEPGILVLDEDDYEHYENVRLPFGWRRLVLPRLFLSPKLNETFRRHPDEPWYGILNDDHLPITDDWEQRIIRAAGESGMAWPHDNYAKRISCHVKSGDLVRELGWFVCPDLNHFYLDDVDELIAKVVPGKFLSDVVVSHEHVNAGRMPMDRTYRERPSNPDDRASFEDWRAQEWPLLREKLSNWLLHRVSVPIETG